MTTLSDHAVCDCGDCQQAIEQELAAFQAELAANPCLHWYAARSVARTTIMLAMVGMEEAAIGFSPINDRASRVADLMGDHFDDALIEKVQAIVMVTRRREDGEKVPLQ
jgi:hypothetical protein